MSEKKELNLEELENVTGGFHEADDPNIGKTVKIYYKGSFGRKKSLEAKILKCGYSDRLNPGTKYYLLDVDNGWIKGWFYGPVIDREALFEDKEMIKLSCILEENIQNYDQVDNNDY